MAKYAEQPNLTNNIKKSRNMCIFTEFFKDYDFRSSGMAKTGCKKVYIYHIFYNEIWWHQKKPLMAWLLL